MSSDYEKERKGLKTKVELLDKKLESAKDQALNTDNFLKLVKKYTKIKKLDTEIIREFMNKIIGFKAVKINGRNNRKLGYIITALVQLIYLAKKVKRHSRYSRLCRIF